MVKNSVEQTKLNEEDNRYPKNSLARGSLVSLFVLAFAIYLYFNCNKDSTNIGELILALCFSPCYVIYKLVTGIDKCFKPRMNTSSIIVMTPTTSPAISLSEM